MNKLQIIDHLNGVYIELMAASLSKGGLRRSCIAGGALASLVFDEEPKDFDVWFEDEAAFADACLGVTFKKETRYAHTFTLPSGRIIQYVKSRLGSPEKIVGGFDFRHTQSYYKPSGELLIDEKFILSKELSFVRGNLTHPVNTVQRAMKFAKRGYRMSQPNLIDMIVELRAADFELIRKDTGGSR